MSRLIRLFDPALAVVYAFFACFPVIKGTFSFCESTAKSGKRDFGLIFRFLCSRRRFVRSFGESLRASVTLIFSLTPFFLCAYVPPRFAFYPEYGMFFEVTALFLLFYGVFGWLAYTVFGRADRESVTFAFSFLPHLALMYFTHGAWLLPFLPYAALSIVYSNHD